MQLDSGKIDGDIDIKLLDRATAGGREREREREREGGREGGREGERVRENSFLWWFSYVFMFACPCRACD